jgi:hypothetical protein
MASGQAREEGGDVQQACDFDWHCALFLVASALAARVLCQLVFDGIGDETSTAGPICPHMRLALYDVLAALFVPSDPGPLS